jgi:hypothetical protein
MARPQPIPQQTAIAAPSRTLYSPRATFVKGRIALLRRGPLGVQVVGGIGRLLAGGSFLYDHLIKYIDYVF